jgi:hypothetical protein
VDEKDGRSDLVEGPAHHQGGRRGPRPRRRSRATSWPNPATGPSRAACVCPIRSMTKRSRPSNTAPQFSPRGGLLASLRPRLALMIGSWEPPASLSILPVRPVAYWRMRPSGLTVR